MCQSIPKPGLFQKVDSRYSMKKEKEYSCIDMYLIFIDYYLAKYWPGLNEERNTKCHFHFTKYVPYIHASGEEKWNVNSSILKMKISVLCLDWLAHFQPSAEVK